MNILCVKCKGRGYCGRSFCPHLAKSEAMFKVKENLPGEDFSGSAPAPFVGRYGYPNINVGIMSVPDMKDAWMYDAPNYWAEHGFQIPQIINYRSSLINSRFVMNIKKKDKMLDIAQEVGMASRPADTEVHLEEKPRFRLNVQSVMAPTGPHAKLKKAEITSNTKIDSKVDKVVSDTDLKSVEGLNYLYSKGFDENFLSGLLSVGTLGIGRKRKLVPTRWSITATDDTLGKQIISDIKDYPEYDYAAYFGSYLGNYYLVLCFPDVWAYELFETYMPKSSWNVGDKIEFMTDYEPYAGRKSYADNTAGGYYAARLAVLEEMKRRKKQSSVLALRFITGEYAVPLGVWVVREAARKAMNSKPMIFGDKVLMLKYANALIKKKFGYDLDNLLRESKLLKNINQQKKLTGYL